MEQCTHEHRPNVRVKYCIQNSWNSSNAHHHKWLSMNTGVWVGGTEWGKKKSKPVWNSTALQTVCTAAQYSVGYMGVTLLQFL